jgi:hypothetical protein
MTYINRIDERVTHKAANQAHDAVRRQNSRRRKAVAGNRCALDVVHRFDKVVNSEWYRRDQNNPQKLEA